MLKYSFIEHPLSRLIKNLDTVIPHVKEGYVLYANTSKKIVLNKYNQQKPISLKNKLHLVQKFRSEKGKYGWLQKDMLSFLREDEKKVKKIKQLSLIDEQNNNLLCLKFLSPYDQLYDVVLLELDSAIFYLTPQKNRALSTEQKHVIEQVLYNTINFYLKTEYANLETHRLVVNNISNQQTKLQAALNKGKKIAKNYQKALDYFLSSVVKELGDKEGIEVSFSPSCRTFLYEQEVSLETIKLSVYNAVNVLQNLHTSPVKRLVLEPGDLQIIEHKPQVTVSSVPDKHRNVIEMLNRYEEAAILVREKGLKVNGANVARFCKPSITPAAITFNLKKYANVVNLLVGKYDDKWTLIKQEFKPLINVLKGENLNKRKQVG